jgi:antitoxin component of MazEF toxin-antitoxin module
LEKQNISLTVKQLENSLDDLLKKVTPANLHPQVNTGIPVGEEVIT